jgi:hypothetical protein
VFPSEFPFSSGDSVQLLESPNRRLRIKEFSFYSTLGIYSGSIALSGGENQSILSLLHKTTVFVLQQCIEDYVDNAYIAELERDSFTLEQEVEEQLMALAIRLIKQPLKTGTGLASTHNTLLNYVGIRSFDIKAYEKTSGF